MHGRHVFMGYLNDEAKTKEVLDDNGGLHSGDIGRKDSNGFLYITGRIKGREGRWRVRLGNGRNSDPKNPGSIP